MSWHDYNHDDSGGTTPVDLTAFRKRQREVDPNRIDTAEDKMRLLQAIYNDDEVDVADQLAAIELHNLLQGHLERAANRDVAGDSDGS